MISATYEKCHANVLSSIQHVGRRSESSSLLYGLSNGIYDERQNVSTGRLIEVLANKMPFRGVSKVHEKLSLY